MEAQILKHIMEVAHTPVRVFDAEGKLQNYYGDDQENDVVLTDEKLQNILKKNANERYPYLHEVFYPIYFSSISFQGKYYIIGPVNVDYTVKSVKNAAVGVHLANMVKTNQKCIRVSYCPFTEFCREVLLLYNILNNSDLSYSEMVDSNSQVEEIQGKLQKELNQIYFDFQESGKLHHPYDYETRQMNTIRDGDEEGLRKSLNISFEGEYGTLAKDPLRSMKNLAISGITLAARAAISGGVLSEEAFSISDSAILQVEAAGSIMQAKGILQQTQIVYARLVKERRNSVQNNHIVEGAKTIVYKKMHEKIVIKDVAEQLSVTPEYLSTLFKKVEGISLNDYIVKTKVGIAENLLIYSNYSIEDIGYYLGFCSQSHFGKNFKKWKGVTPKKYRDQFGVPSFIDSF